MYFFVQEYKADNLQDIRVSQKTFQWSYSEEGDILKTNLAERSFALVPAPATDSCEKVFVFATFTDPLGSIDMFEEFQHPNPNCTIPTTTTTTPDPVPAGPTPTTIPQTVRVEGTGELPRGCLGSNVSPTPVPGVAEPEVPAFCATKVPYSGLRPYGVLKRNLTVTGGLTQIGATCPAMRNLPPFPRPYGPYNPPPYGLAMHEYFAIRFKPDNQTAINFFAVFDPGGATRSLITVSECPGDFGPDTVADFGSERAPAAGSTAGQKACVFAMGVDGGFTIATRDYPGITSTSCLVDPKKNYYVNIIHNFAGTITQQPQAVQGSDGLGYGCVYYPNGRCGITTQPSLTGRLLND